MTRAALLHSFDAFGKILGLHQHALHRQLVIGGGFDSCRQSLAQGRARRDNRKRCVLGNLTGKRMRTRPQIGKWRKLINKSDSKRLIAL